MNNRIITLILVVLLALGSFAEKRTTQATLFRQFKPSVITLKDGRQVKQSLTNVFLKNSSLIYLKGEYTMEANMDNIAVVEFDDVKFININNKLAYLIGDVGKNALYRIDLLDVDAYNAHLRNNVNISNLDVGEMVSVTTLDTNTEDDYKFPIFPHFYYRYNGEFVTVHEREIWRKMPKDKELRRMFKTIIGEPTFSWTDNDSLMKLLKAITPEQ